MSPMMNRAAFIKARAVLNILRTSGDLTDEFLKDPLAVSNGQGIQLTRDEVLLVNDVLNNTSKSPFAAPPASTYSLRPQDDKLAELQQEWLAVDPR